MPEDSFGRIGYYLSTTEAPEGELLLTELKSPTQVGAGALLSCQEAALAPLILV